MLAAAFIGWMYYQTAYVPGGQPIGGIERWFSRGTKALMSMIKRLNGGQLREADESSS